MKNIIAAIERRGGLASRRELIADGLDPELVDLCAWYGRHMVRVRAGWYARPGENREVTRAWRVGGRLTCASAIAFHEGATPPPALHVEVPANAARLRDPDDSHQPLGTNAAVVVHWTRYPGPGSRRAVSSEHAEAVASVCGVRAGAIGHRAVAPSPSPSPQPDYAAARA